MKRLKLFEEYSPEDNISGFMSVPPDFEERVKMSIDDAKAKQEVYKVPKNQFRIDLYYAIYNGIKDFLRGVDDHWFERTQKEYERKLNDELDGVLYKFSGGGGPNLNNIQDKDEIRTLLWGYINIQLPYDEVDYKYTYNLRDKVLKLSEDFTNEIINKKLFK